MRKTTMFVFVLAIMLSASFAHAAGTSNTSLNYVWNGTSWIPWLATSDGKPYVYLDLVNVTSNNLTVNYRAGIGTSSPAYPLDVSGAGRFSGNLYLGTAGRYVYDTGSIIGVSSGLLLGGNLDMGGNNITKYNYLVANDSAKLNGQAASYYLDTSSTAQTKSGSMTVTGAWLNATNLNVSSNGYFGGNVGIGTTGPTRLLTVQGTTNNWFRLGAGSTNSNEFFSVFGGNPGAVSGHTYNDAPAIVVPKFLRFFTNASDEGGTGATLTMLLDNNGNVGIGTASPGSAKLNVSGNISISGSNTGIVFQDGTTQTSAGAVLIVDGTNWDIQYVAAGLNTFSFSCPVGYVAIAVSCEANGNQGQCNLFNAVYQPSGGPARNVSCTWRCPGSDRLDNQVKATCMRQ